MKGTVERTGSVRLRFARAITTLQRGVDAQTAASVSRRVRQICSKTQSSQGIIGLQMQISRHYDLTMVKKKSLASAT